MLWVTQTIGFFGYSSWAPTLLAQEGFSVEKSIFYVALTTVGAPLGSFLAALVTDRFERKWCLVVFGTVIAICGLLLRADLQPDPDRGVRLPGQPASSAATRRWPTPTRPNCSTPAAARWAPASPTAWAGCRTPPAR